MWKTQTSSIVGKEKKKPINDKKVVRLSDVGGLCQGLEIECKGDEKKPKRNLFMHLVALGSRTARGWGTPIGQGPVFFWIGGGKQGGGCSGKKKKKKGVKQAPKKTTLRKDHLPGKGVEGEPNEIRCARQGVPRGAKTQTSGEGWGGNIPIRQGGGGGKDPKCHWGKGGAGGVVEKKQPSKEKPPTRRPGLPYGSLRGT